MNLCLHSCPFFHFCPCFPSSRKDPFILPRASPAATHSLTLHAQIVTHAFIMEAVGGEWLCSHDSYTVHLKYHLTTQAPYSSEASAVGISLWKNSLKYDISKLQYWKYTKLSAISGINRATVCLFRARVYISIHMTSDQYECFSQFLELALWVCIENVASKNLYPCTVTKL